MNNKTSTKIRTRRGKNAKLIPQDSIAAKPADDITPSGSEQTTIEVVASTLPLPKVVYADVPPTTILSDDMPIIIEVEKPVATWTWCANQYEWQTMAEAVVGLQHRDHQLPCQDAVSCAHHPRTCLVVCDGAGSAAVSELGAQALAVGMQRLLHSLEYDWIDLLDNTATIHEDQTRRMVRLLLRHAKGLLQDLAQLHRRDVRDFRSTLLMLVMGKEHLLWLKVGDGALIIEKIQQHKLLDEHNQPQLQPVLTTLGGLGKGEFANQTTFIDDSLLMSNVQFGVESSTDITGVAAMSDGAAEKLVSVDGLNVSGQLSQWLNALRLQKLTRRELTQAFYSERFVRGSTGDDRSIALASTRLKI